MMDTGQPGLAPENVALDNAADAFKAYVNQEPINPVKPRDEQGRFAPAQTDEGGDQADAAPQGELEDETAIDSEAADDAQPDPIDMPSSWSNDDQEIWETLPAEAQARIAEREAERDRGLNLKLQEAANVRKDFESRLTEANANRDKFAQAADFVLSLVQPQAPDPVQYGLGTDNFNRDAYELARYQYDQQAQIVAQLSQQREEISAQQARDAEEAAKAVRAEIESTWFPKLIADVPEIKDPAKSAETVNSIIGFAVENGIPREAFANANAITSAEMRLAWMAMQWSKEQAAKARVKAGNPPPKPASPPVRPGTVASRQSIQTRNLRAAQDRLAQEGSIEAGADVFKQLAPMR